MLNFIHWVALHHPEVKRLGDQSEESLLKLVNDFERGKVAGNPTLCEKWRVGFHFLLKEDNDREGYGEARKALAGLEQR